MKGVSLTICSATLDKNLMIASWSAIDIRRMFNWPVSAEGGCYGETN